jgi:hypothetical protein
MIRKIITAFSALVMVMVGIVAVAPPANAASEVSYCFKFPNGALYARMPAFIQLSTDTVNWSSVNVMETDPYGCGTFSISGNFTEAYARVQAQYNVEGTVHRGSPAYWIGITPYYALPGQGAVNLGTGVMDCIQRVPYACVGM